MPDKTLQTISATQVPALFNQSPYMTLYMLWHHFKNGLPLDADPNERMEWGFALQTIIIEAAAKKLRLEHVENVADEYSRSPDFRVGCTIDGFMLDPSRGLGFVECKNVDGLVFRDQWTDDAAPPHIELQHQTQLMVPHPEHGLPKWGVIAALVGGNELKLYERQPLDDVQNLIAGEATAFFESLEKGIEPDAFGDEKEIAALAFLYPEAPELKTLVIDDPDKANAFADTADQYAKVREQRLISEKAEKQLKAKLLATAKDNGIVIAANCEAIIKKTVTKQQVKKLPVAALESLSGVEDPGIADIIDAGGVITRKAGLKQTVTVRFGGTA